MTTHRITAADCDRGKHDFGRSFNASRAKNTSSAAFCLVCGEPNPRCIDCGRLVAVTRRGAVRCVKGHTHRLDA